MRDRSMLWIVFLPARAIAISNSRLKMVITWVTPS